MRIADGVDERHGRHGSRRGGRRESQAGRPERSHTNFDGSCTRPACMIGPLNKEAHMAEQVLQINFALNVSPAEYRNLAAGVADAFAQVPGLRWKVWFLDDQAREAGGIYLFEDEQ